MSTLRSQRLEVFKVFLKTPHDIFGYIRTFGPHCGTNLYFVKRNIMVMVFMRNRMAGAKEARPFYANIVVILKA